MSTADALFVSLTVAMSVGIGVALGRTKEPRALAVTVVWLTGSWAWLGLVAMLSALGVFADPFALPPRLPLVPVGALLLLAAASRLRIVRAAIDAIPLSALTGAQAYRVLVEVALWLLYREHRAPQQVTFEGRNFDVLVGLSAPVVAWLIARGRASRRLVLAWNVASLAVLANTVFTVITSTRGRLHLDWSGGTFDSVSEWPVITLPALLAPLAVALHLQAMRAALRSSTETTRQ